MKLQVTVHKHLSAVKLDLFQKKLVFNVSILYVILFFLGMI